MPNTTRKLNNVTATSNKFQITVNHIALRAVLAPIREYDCIRNSKNNRVLHPRLDQQQDYLGLRDRMNGSVPNDPIEVSDITFRMLKIAQDEYVQAIEEARNVKR